MMDTEFYSKNKFEKLLRVVGFIIRKYSEAFPTPISNPVHWTSMSLVMQIDTACAKLGQPVTGEPT